MNKAQRELVQKIGTNLMKRYATSERIRTTPMAPSTYVKPTKPFPLWIDGKKFEGTYLQIREPNILQDWTVERVIEEAQDVTIGANQDIDWFMTGLGKWLTKRSPGFTVTVHPSEANSRKKPTTPSLYFSSNFIRGYKA